MYESTKFFKFYHKESFGSPSDVHSTHTLATNYLLTKMVSYVSKLASKTTPYFGKLNLKNLIDYTPNLAIWGGSSFAAIFVFTEGWPKFQNTLYKKIPYFGSHWVVEIPPEDAPN